MNYVMPCSIREIAIPVTKKATTNYKGQNKQKEKKTITVKAQYLILGAHGNKVKIPSDKF